MIVSALDATELLRFELLAGLAGLAHAITCKPWNMACHCGPDAGSAPDCRRRVCEYLGLPFEMLTCAEQVHGNELAVVDAATAGAGRNGRASAVRGVDGLLTDRPGVGLMLLSADCPLVVVFDPRRRAVGVAHASWKGTVGQISRRLVGRMTAAFGSDPADLYAGVGPSAGPGQYVVGSNVLERAAASLADHERYFRQTPAGMTFDLWAANRDQLADSGISPDRIELAGLCTMRDERFFSYRREGPRTGRFALVAAVRSA